MKSGDMSIDRGGMCEIRENTPSNVCMFLPPSRANLKRLPEIDEAVNIPPTANSHIFSGYDRIAYYITKKEGGGNLAWFSTK